jgi:hypothetical protein
MNSVRRSWIFSAYCSGLTLMIPISSRKFSRRDLARRFRTRARSECEPEPEGEGVSGGV